MFESLRRICDYNESYFARRAMLIGLRFAIFLQINLQEYTEKIISGLINLKSNLNNLIIVWCCCKSIIINKDYKVMIIII